MATYGFSVIVVRLFHLQIYERSKYWNYSQKNRIRRLILRPPRGLIYDRFAEVLVDNSPIYSISAIPFESARNDTVIRLLSAILAESPLSIKTTLARAEGRFSPVKLRRDVDFGTVVKMEERKLDLPGVVLEIDSKRSYPAGVQAPHIFGYIGEVSSSELAARKKEGLRMGDMVGKRGLEKVYDKQLRGRVGYDYIEVDALGREVRDITEQGEIPPKRGNDIYLTLDARLQLLAEQLFEDKRGGVVLIDVRDGGILAMSSEPHFDPQIFAGVVDGETWRKLVNDPGKPLYDRMIQSVYPPGSTYKLVLAAAALENDIIRPDYSTFCKGYVSLGARIFRCWKASGHGKVDLYDAIAHSCNVYFYRLSLKTGVDPWADFARRFGFGKPTGIDLLAESSGLVPDRVYLDRVYGKSGWSKGMLLNLGIGQGDLLVTPLQMAQFAMILANRGIYYRPHLLNRIYDVEHQEFINYRPERREVQGISQKTFDVLLEGMYRVVNMPGGTGRACYLPDVRVAGKTGTAQNPHGEPHAWFIGFAPFDNPEVAICVLVENGGSGGAHAAPIARKILRRYFDDRKPPLAHAIANK